MLARTETGLALVAVLLLSLVIGTVALGLALLMSLQQMATRNARESAALAAAATAGLELAAAALGAADWDAVLGGAAVAPGSDGPPRGVRTGPAGAAIDLETETHRLNCGQPTPCSAAALGAVTAERPWGPNNPAWRLFLYGPLAGLASYTRAPPAYVLVWVGDDAREDDANPARDGGGTNGPGADVVMLRAVAVGRAGGRRGVEAEATRICRAGPARPACQPGIRVQSWRDLRRSVP